MLGFHPGNAQVDLEPVVRHETAVPEGDPQRPGPARQDRVDRSLRVERAEQHDHGEGGAPQPQLPVRVQPPLLLRVADAHEPEADEPTGQPRAVDPGEQPPPRLPGHPARQRRWRRVPRRPRGLRRPRRLRRLRRTCQYGFQHPGGPPHAAQEAVARQHRQAEDGHPHAEHQEPEAPVPVALEGPHPHGDDRGERHDHQEDRRRGRLPCGDALCSRRAGHHVPRPPPATALIRGFYEGRGGRRGGRCGGEHALAGPTTCKLPSVA